MTDGMKEGDIRKDNSLEIGNGVLRIREVATIGDPTVTLIPIRTSAMDPQAQGATITMKMNVTTLGEEDSTTTMKISTTRVATDG